MIFKLDLIHHIENSMLIAKFVIRPRLIILIQTYHEQLQQQHQQKQQGLLLLLVERILLAPLEFEFNGPSLPGAIVVGDPRVPPTADIFENVLLALVF